MIDCITKWGGKMSEDGDSWFKAAFGVDLGQALSKVKDGALAVVEQVDSKVTQLHQEEKALVDGAIDGVANLVKKGVDAVLPAGPGRPGASGGGTGSLPLGGSVGRGGKNAPNDVRAVQTALGIAPGGQCDTPTIAAIEAFQRKMGQARPDGRVDAGGKTERALASRGSAPAVVAASPAQGDKRGVMDKLQEGTFGVSDLENGAIGASDLLAQRLIDANAGLNDSVIDALPISEDAKDTARTAAKFQKGMQEGAYAAVKGMGESALSGVKLATGATFNEYAGKIGSATVDDKAAERLNAEVSSGVDRAAGTAKMVAGLTITPSETGREMGEKVVGDYKAAAARDEGAEFVGKGVGFATVMGLGLVAGGALGEAGAASEEAVLLSEGAADGGAMGGVAFEEGAIGATREPLPTTLPESARPTLRSRVSVTLDEPMPSTEMPPTEMPPTEMPPTEADPMRSPLAESVRAPQADAADPFAKTEVDPLGKTHPEAPAQVQTTHFTEEQQAFFESTQKYLRYKQMGPGGVAEDLSQWDPKTEEVLRDQMMRSRESSFKASSAAQKGAKGRRGGG